MSVRVEGIDEAKEHINGLLEGAIGLIGLEFTGRVVEKTPVDTGFARNSWIMTKDRDDEGTPGANNPAQSALVVVGSYKLGESYYINNGAEYIGFLEDGRSNQAPNGMVDTTLPELPEIADKALRASMRSRG